MSDLRTDEEGWHPLQTGADFQNMDKYTAKLGDFLVISVDGMVCKFSEKRLPFSLIAGWKEIE